LFKKPNTLEWKVILGKSKLIENRWIAPSRKKWLIEKSAPDAEEQLMAKEAVSWFMRHSKPKVDILISDIHAIKLLCEQNGTKLHILITPRYYKSLYWRNFSVIEEFKKKLAEITPYYDFSNLNRFATSPRYWIDTSHFTHPVSKQMLLALSENQKARDLFGRKVTAMNIDKHVKQLRAKLVSRMTGLMRYDSNLVIHPSLLGPNDCFKQIDVKSLVFTPTEDGRGLATIPSVSECEPAQYVLSLKMKAPVNAESISLLTHNRKVTLKSKRRFLHRYCFLINAEDMRRGMQIEIDQVTGKNRILSLTAFNVPSI